jgi:hypothetical protein
MTEEEWLRCADLKELLLFVCQKRRAESLPGPGEGIPTLLEPADTYVRKRRLWHCACCRRVQHLMTDKGKAALAVAERYAERQVSGQAAQPVGNRAVAAGQGWTRADYATVAAGWACWGYTDVPFRRTGSSFDGGFTATVQYALRAATGVNDPIRAYREWVETLREAEGERQEVVLRSEDELVLREGAYATSLVRCIFGNPFRPGVIDPDWLRRDGSVAKLAQGIYEDESFDDLPILADALEEAGCTAAGILAHCREAGPHARGCWPVDTVLGKS